MAGRVSDIVMSDIYIDPKIWKSQDIKFVYLREGSLEELTKAVTDELIQSRNPLNMTINIYQNQAGYRSNIALERSAAEIMKVAQDFPQHKIAFCCVIFKPDMEDKWSNIGMFNQHTRLLNIQNKVPPMNLHKAVMEQGDHGLMIKGYLWKEFCQHSGKGYNLNYKGMVKVRDFLVKYHRESMTMRDIPNSKLYVKYSQPMPLSATEGYCHNQSHSKVNKPFDLQAKLSNRRKNDLRPVINYKSSQRDDDRQRSSVRNDSGKRSYGSYQSSGSSVRDDTRKRSYRSPVTDDNRYQASKVSKEDDNIKEREREIERRERKLKRREKENEERLAEIESNETKKFQLLERQVIDCQERTEKMQQKLLDVEKDMRQKETSFRQALVEKELEVAILMKKNSDKAEKKKKRK